MMRENSTRAAGGDPGWLQHLIEIEARALDHPTAAPAVDSAPAIQRVAIFSEAFLPKVDGVTRTALLTLEHLRRTGREVLIFAPAPAPSQVDGIPVIQVPSLWLPDYPDTRVPLLWPRIWGVLSRFRPDLIHLFSPLCLGATGMIAGGALGVPVIANYMTDLPAYAERYGFGGVQRAFIGALRWLHNGCTLTLAPTRWTQTEIAGWGFRRLRVWGRGVDSTRFNPLRRSPEWRQRLLAGRDPQSLIALYVGRMAKEKDIQDLERIARLPGVALTLVGDGSHRRQMESFLNRDGRSACFLGEMLGDDLVQAYAAADVFVFPGARETFGQVVLEAMASGLPVIVANRGGPAALVVEGETGFICTVGDPQSYAARVQQLQDDPTLRTRIGQNARQFALVRPWSAVMQELEQHYQAAARLYGRFKRQQ